MQTPPRSDLRSADARRDLRLVLLACSGPLLWFALLGWLFAVSTHECGGPLPVGSWLLWSLASGVSALLVALSWRALGVAPAHAAHVARLRFMRELALAINALCLLLSLGFVAPLLGLQPCD